MMNESTVTFKSVNTWKVISGHNDKVMGTTFGVVFVNSCIFKCLQIG